MAALAAASPTSHGRLAPESHAALGLEGDPGDALEMGLEGGHTLGAGLDAQAVLAAAALRQQAGSQ
jgi:hypothetical protein